MQTIASHLKESGIIDCKGGLRTKDARNKAKISRGVKRNWATRRQKYPSCITLNTIEEIEESNPTKAGENK